METKLGQEPAFPTSEIYGLPFSSGINKRFYAACAAMQGMLANEELRMKILADQRNGQPDIIGCAYQYADELLKQENQ